MAANSPPFFVLKKAVPGTLQKGQDAVFSLYENDVLAVALADGVSSAGQLAVHGASAAVDAAAHFMTEKFDEIIMADAAFLRNYLYTLFRDYYLRTLNQLAERINLPLVLDGGKMVYQNFDKYSTTILACAVKGDRLILLKIGNGIIAADTGEGVGVVSPSRIVCGRTPCIERIIDPGFADFTFKRYAAANLHLLVLMSDGVEFAEACLYDGETETLHENFVPWFRAATQSEDEFSDSIDRLGRIGQDDISMVFMLKTGENFDKEFILPINPLKHSELYCIVNNNTPLSDSEQPPDADQIIQSVEIHQSDAEAVVPPDVSVETGVSFDPEVKIDTTPVSSMEINISAYQDMEAVPILNAVEQPDIHIEPSYEIAMQAAADAEESLAYPLEKTPAPGSALQDGKAGQKGRHIKKKKRTEKRILSERVRSFTSSITGLFRSRSYDKVNDVTALPDHTKADLSEYIEVFYQSIRAFLMDDSDAAEERIHALRQYELDDKTRSLAELLWQQIVRKKSKEPLE